jgi:hypothetical protein
MKIDGGDAASNERAQRARAYGEIPYAAAEKPQLLEPPSWRYTYANRAVRPPAGSAEEPKARLQVWWPEEVAALAVTASVHPGRPYRPPSESQKGGTT